MSVDYAVMEKTDDAVVVPLDAGWNDVGSWSALWERRQKDETATSSTAMSSRVDTRDTLVHADTGSSPRWA